MSVVEIFRSGGPVMWPLLVCSLIALAIIFERAYSLRTSRILNPQIVERLHDLTQGGKLELALDTCAINPGLFSNIIGPGLVLARQGESESVAKEAIEDAGRHETTRLHRYLGTLSTIVGISPLLGLLGTVTGMIRVFKTIAETGGGQAVQLSSGISQALITTATGLLIAIPALVAYNYLNEKAESLVSDLERDSLRVLRSFFRGPRGSSERPATDPGRELAPGAVVSS